MNRHTCKPLFDVAHERVDRFRMHIRGIGEAACNPQPSAEEQAVSGADPWRCGDILWLAYPG